MKCLHKNEVLRFLQETKCQLWRTKREIDIIVRLDKLINKPECCILLAGCFKILFER